MAVALSVAIAGFAAASSLRAQDDALKERQNSRTDTSYSDTAPANRVLPHTSTWKFGLRIHAAGRTSGIQATVPVPTNWPDQSVELIEQAKTPNVTLARLQKVGKDGQQLFIKINSLNPNQTAEATVTLKIVKHDSVAPRQTDSLEIPRKIPAGFRTYLTPSPYIESSHPSLKQLSKTITTDKDQNAWSQVHQIYDWVRDNIEYKFDTQIHSCLEALETGHGDCEELSSLFIAICRVRGIPARAVWIPDHTYPEFYLVDEQGKGRWYPCQAAGPYAFGRMPERKPILQKGDKFRVPGHRDPLRYIQPTLRARDAASAPRVEWVMQEVK